jgi:hypothetical protein
MRERDAVERTPDLSAGPLEVNRAGLCTNEIRIDA